MNTPTKPNQKMKAAVYTQYGPPEMLHVKEVAMPEPNDHEILVRIHATAVNSGDVRLRKADPFAVRFFFGLFKPKLTILGSVFSGIVERTGKQVSRFKKGDQIFGHTDMRFGAYAEYICVQEESSLALKPTHLTHQEAAAIPFGGVTAWHFLNKVDIKENQKVLVMGASGAVGSAAVQLAKAQGAIVTGVCSTSNLGLVKSLGADHVLDYTKEDFTQNGQHYDVIFDSVKTISVTRSLKSLSANGKLILSAAGMSEMLLGLWISLTSKRKVLTGVIRHQASDIAFLKELAEASKFKPVLDKMYALDKIAEAHAYVEKGHKKGNVMITLN